MEPSPGSTSSLGGRGGKAKAASSDSDSEVDATAVDDVAPSPVDSSDNGILGTAIEDLNIGSFPGGGAPVGFNVG